MNTAGRRRWAVIAITVTLLSGLTTGSGAIAQAPADPEIDFIVTPSRLELRTPAGGRLETDVTVYNRDADPLVLDAYVENILLPPNELLSPDELAFTASRWVRFVEDGLVVPPGENASITLVADVPAGTPTGGYHAFGFLQSRPPEDATGFAPSGRVGVTLLLEVAPDGIELERAVRVSESGLDVKWNGLFDARVEAHTIIENIGDAHVTTGGVHTYRSWPGSASQDAKVGPHTTLRGSRHTFESSWDAVPLFGKVTVTSEIVYQVGPDDLPVIVTQHTVWIIPWRLIGVSLALIIVAVLLVRHRRAARRDPSDHDPSDKAEHHEEPTEELASTS